MKMLTVSFHRPVLFGWFLLPSAHWIRLNTGPHGWWGIHRSSLTLAWLRFFVEIRFHDRRAVST